MLRTLWGSLQALSVFLGLGVAPDDLLSADSDLSPMIAPNG